MLLPLNIELSYEIEVQPLAALTLIQFYKYFASQK